jgi:hypothetical protein
MGPKRKDIHTTCLGLYEEEGDSYIEERIVARTPERNNRPIGSREYG